MIATNWAGSSTTGSAPCGSAGGGLCVDAGVVVGVTFAVGPASADGCGDEVGTGVGVVLRQPTMRPQAVASAANVTTHLCLRTGSRACELELALIIVVRNSRPILPG